MIFAATYRRFVRETRRVALFMAAPAGSGLVRFDMPLLRELLMEGWGSSRKRGSIGKLIDERSEWGNRFVEPLFGDIRVVYPGIKGFSVRSLKYMLRLAREYDFEFVQQLAAQIPWGHTMCLFDKVGDRDEGSLSLVAMK